MMKPSLARIATRAEALAGALAALRRPAKLDLAGKVAVVTGGSRGLGLVLARELVAHGVRVALCARDVAELERARADLESRGGDVVALACDVTKRADIEGAVADARWRLGPIDILICNAGVIQVGPMELMTDDDLETALATHVWAPHHAARAVLADMRERGGRIVNVASVGGKIAVPHMLPYSTSKFALVGLSEGMRVELAKHGVLVTTVVPGLMRTGSPMHARFKGNLRAEYGWFAASDSLRATSMSADRAAKKIIAAMRRGDPEVVLSVQAKLATTLAALAPGLVQRALAVVDRLLPAAPTGDHDDREHATAGAPGSELGPAPMLARATDRAARHNNEL
jgi:NAD(P)-dependent dehydrogenase (short-subunit alcohol dehydrogenase family)|nr:SDR family NAD(P)-dependent oxidoreductase [Kofleriaceae bacterium]